MGTTTSRTRRVAGRPARLGVLVCAALAACGGSASRASEPAPACAPAQAAALDLAWLVAPETTKLVRVELESREGYGADFVRDELDFVVAPSGEPSATWTRTILGSQLAARASRLTLPRALSTALLEAIAGARPQEPTTAGRVVVSASDVHRRFEVRVRDAADLHHVALFTADGATWRFRADGAELEPTALARALAAIRARLVAPAE